MPAAPCESEQQGPDVKLKVYLVIQRFDGVGEDEPNRRVLAIRMTRSGANIVADQNPDCEVEKWLAYK